MVHGEDIVGTLDAKLPEAINGELTQQQFEMLSGILPQHLTE